MWRGQVRQCPLLTQSGHCGTSDRCPLYARKRTWNPAKSSTCELTEYREISIGRWQADARPHGSKLFTSSSRMTRNAAGKLICEPSGKIIAALVAVKEFPVLAAT